MRTRILLTDTHRYAMGARLAISFIGLGCDVAMLCPPAGHPIRAVKQVRFVYPYRGLSALSCLRAAIRDFRPDLVVPICDRGVAHLHLLHAQSVKRGDSALASCIERSLGSPRSFPIVENRYAFLMLARQEGIPIPETRLVEPSDSFDWCDASASWAFKTDGSWGGEGVSQVRTRAEALAAAQSSRRAFSLRWFAKQVERHRDCGFILEEWIHNRHRHLTAQTWIQGRPANCAVACWRGRLLAASCVEVLASNGEIGPSILVELVQGTEMLQAAECIARRLSLSGFFGLDFVVEHDTGRPLLLEINPRSTALAALALGPEHDLPAALLAELSAQPRTARKAVTELKRIAFFPRPAGTSFSGLGEDTYYYDVPHGYPSLAQRLLEGWPKVSMVRALQSLKRDLRPRSAVHETSPGTTLEDVYGAASASSGEMPQSWRSRS